MGDQGHCNFEIYGRDSSRLLKGRCGGLLKGRRLAVTRKELLRSARKQTQTNPLGLSPVFSGGWLKIGKNKPMVAISNRIIGLLRFSGSNLQFLDELSWARLKSREPAKQTQTNPLRLSPDLSIRWTKIDGNKPITSILIVIRYLRRFLGAISRFLDEPHLGTAEEPECGKTNPNKPIGTNSILIKELGQNGQEQTHVDHLQCNQSIASIFRPDFQIFGWIHSWKVKVPENFDRWEALGGS
jgi:hypothetical protein